MPVLFLLFENGDFIELENSSGAILLENQQNDDNVPDVLENFSSGFSFGTISYGF